MRASSRSLIEELIATNSTATISRALGCAATTAYAVLLLFLLVRYFGEALGFLPSAAPTPARRKGALGRAALTVLASFVLSRLLYFLSALVYARITGGGDAYLANLPGAWVRWDAYHYIKIAEQWYVNVGDDRYKIVFYPLYPLLVRGVCLTGLPARAAAYLVSNACTLGAGFAMHALVRHDQGGAAADRAVWLMMFSPLGFFFSIPYSESLFLLLCLLVALTARKKRFHLAVLFGALCSATRALGILCAPILFFSLLQDAWQRYSQREGARRRDAAFLGRAALCVARVLPVSLGLIAYLILNYRVTGSAFTFLTYQSEHWGQNFGSLYNTLQYSFVNAVEYGSFEYRICLWIPQVIAIIAVLALLWAVWRRLQAGDAAFAILYYYCSIAPTWLLSGTRYLAAMYALYPALALLTNKKWAFILALLLMAALSAYMSALYIVAGCVL